MFLFLLFGSRSLILSFRYSIFVPVSSASFMSYIVQIISNHVTDCVTTAI
jgi:hypothetical protein